MRLVSQVAFAAALAITAISFRPAPASAQGSVFCPPGFPVFQAGSCTAQDGEHGSLGVPALASQSVSEISQSTTQQSNNTTVEVVRKRRAQEAGSSEPGVLMFAPQSLAELSYRDNGPFASAPSRIYKIEPVYDAVHPAVWTYGFGGFEDRTANFQTTFQDAGRPTTTAVNVSVDSNTQIWGVVSGADLTFRNIGPSGGALIAGLLTGYTASDIDLTAISTSATPFNPGTTTSISHVHLSGPSAGAYATLFEGPISADLTFKADFLSINDNFFQHFSCCPSPPAGPGPVDSNGIASSQVNNLSTIGNFNYRFPLYPTIWVEPTAGFNYTYSLYNSSAQALGLANGYVLRLQEGARLGSDFFWHNVHVTPTITALLYDDVAVTGGPIANGAFVGGALLPGDEGKLRGEGIFAMNFDYSNGFSCFVSGAIYGGEDLLGAGGRAGLRYQW
jgi:hypothetical protein